MKSTIENMGHPSIALLVRGRFVSIICVQFQSRWKASNKVTTDIDIEKILIEW